MTPYYEEPGITIYHADCRDVLPLLAEREQFDLLLTDPPYGIGSIMQGGSNTGSWQRLSNGNPWDMETPDMSAWLQLAETCIVWGGNYFPLPPSRCWLAWVKNNAVPTAAAMELAWTNMDKPAKVFNWRNGGYLPGIHPTQKPLELILWAISLAPASETVLDPFMGSGTTLRACKDLGKRCIGIEREERYCEIAVNRLAQGVLAFA